MMFSVKSDRIEIFMSYTYNYLGTNNKERKRNVREQSGVFIVFSIHFYQLCQIKLLPSNESKS